STRACTRGRCHAGRSDAALWRVGRDPKIYWISIYLRLGAWFSQRVGAASPRTAGARESRERHHHECRMHSWRVGSTIAALVASAGMVVALGGFTRPVDQSQAKTIAIKACGGGTIKSESDGGMRNGDKVYTFDVNVANKSFVEKVNVDAKTGAVLDVTYAGQQA